jgi:hypothetical protein
VNQERFSQAKRVEEEVWDEYQRLAHIRNRWFIPMLVSMYLLTLVWVILELPPFIPGYIIPFLAWVGVVIAERRKGKEWDRASEERFNALWDELP